MTNGLQIVQALLICASTWFLWRFFRYLVVKSDLDNLPGPSPPSFLFGHGHLLRDRNGWAFHKDLAENYGTATRLYGTLGRKMLYIHDPKAMHHIAVKDQEIFEEATWFSSLTHRAFGPGLLATNGDQHRKQRKILNPVFSVAHMRHMMPIFYNVVHRLREAIETRVQGNAVEEVDMLGWMGRTALELVGQAGLGYSFDPLTQDKADDYGNALKSFVPTGAGIGVFVQLLPLAEAVIPDRLLAPLGKLLPFPALHQQMHNVRMMRTRSREIYEQKKLALAQGDEAVKLQIGEGKDIMSVLVKANTASAEGDRMSEEELVGQMTTLTFAAMDTTSNALSITLWRLAQNQDIQQRLRQEIFDAQDAQGGGDIAYDDLVGLPLLDAVCRETLRLHVPAPMRFRECRHDTVLPLLYPVRGNDGKMMHEIFVPKDTPVFVSIQASNKNPDIWGPDADEWKPERWLTSLPGSVADAKMPGVYSNLMTFWAGSRSCIGFKFSQLEMKVVLSVLLSTFKFELGEKPIIWNYAGVVFPSVKREGYEPEMPMKVSLFKQHA